KVPDNSQKPLILAGGLTPENVQSAIVQTRPYAVDVSGGVESSKGKKDIDKVQKFIREVLNA
ncbi:MAG: N-(5'-phosphoribosyl)anthranilate isomerase, partial [Gammaproteobacteria bacterium]